VANARRYAFNQQLRARYAGLPLFDLAAAEATTENGRRDTFALAGARAESLHAAYTDDGGHLNAAGRARAAIEFLHALAAAVRRGLEA
jgi:lysophospholipase L1-like esterase